MLSIIAANFIVFLHLNFVLFVAFGAFFTFKLKRLVILHLPAAVWGALVELLGWQCPLTPLEQGLRQAAGRAGYSGGFIEHYLIPALYPANFSRNMQVVLGVLIVSVNLLVYGSILIKLYRNKRNDEPSRGGKRRIV